MRAMFQKAKQLAPSIIFIDEIDAVGKKRSSHQLQSNDEREQTLNQMLVEMDGFNSQKTVIVIGATNRPEVLDKALLRPGRFDRKIIINLPDLKGRYKILKIHIKNIPVKKNIDIKTIAKSTSGFSGADLANLINEAALLAAKKNLKKITNKELESSKDKIIMGASRKSLIMNQQQKELTAYHESGHAIVSIMVPYHDPIHKITIIPHGQSLGTTMFLPKNDNILLKKTLLESKISALYGGRIAEEIIYGFENISIGASNDIKIATYLAQKMITKWGFSKKIAPLIYNKNILNNKYIYSEYINKIIDKEIQYLIKKNYKIAKKILTKNINLLHKMKKKLIKYETLNKKQIFNLIKKYSI